MTLLAAELAESVRALAVSQGEVERLRGALEEISALKGGHSPAERGPCGVCRAITLARDALAPPTPTASPEPDRGSPEVTAKESSK